LQIGGTGISIGTLYWKRLINDHFLGENGQTYETGSNLYSVFSEKESGRLVPRTVFVDNDPLSFDYYEKSSFSSFFSGSSRCLLDPNDNTFELFISSVAREAEKCDNLETIQVVLSTGGKIASNISSMLYQVIPEHLGNVKIVTHALVPSASDTSTHNNTLISLSSLHQFEKNSIVLYDTDRIWNIVNLRKGNNDTLYTNVDSYVASVMSHVTLGNRYFCELDFSLNKLFTKGFYTVSLFPPEISSNKYVSNSLLKGILDSEIHSIPTNPFSQKLFSRAVIFKGNLSTFSVLNSFKDFQAELSNNSDQKPTLSLGYAQKNDSGSSVLMLSKDNSTIEYLEEVGKRGEQSNGYDEFLYSLKNA